MISLHWKRPIREKGKKGLEVVTKTIGPRGMEILVESGSHEKHDYRAELREDSHIQSGGGGLSYRPFTILRGR